MEGDATQKLKPYAQGVGAGRIYPATRQTVQQSAAYGTQPNWSCVYACMQAWHAEVRLCA
eukprot:1137281-Pelagomonas_calceolata.AAC.4